MQEPANRKQSFDEEHKAHFTVGSRQHETPATFNSHSSVATCSIPISTKTVLTAAAAPPNLALRTTAHTAKQYDHSCLLLQNHPQQRQGHHSPHDTFNPALLFIS